MNFNVLTLSPEIFDDFSFGVTKKAKKKNLYTINCFNYRDEADNKHKQVDDKPFGGGEGMVISPKPLAKTLKKIPKDKRGKVIYLSPQGERVNQKKILELSCYKSLTLICGRYEGIDQRFIDKYVDEEISIADIIISGGELAALILIDAISRNIANVIGNKNSVSNDTFSNNLLKGPIYTRPEVFENLTIPSVLMSGNHQSIKKWRENQSIKRTLLRRPDLIKDIKTLKKYKKLLEEWSSEDIL